MDLCEFKVSMVWSTEQVLGQPRLHKEILSPKKKKEKKKRWLSYDSCYYCHYWFKILEVRFKPLCLVDSLCPAELNPSPHVALL